jgi:hypothetical protein
VYIEDLGDSGDNARRGIKDPKQAVEKPV